VLLSGICYQESYKSTPKEDKVKKGIKIKAVEG
jgi:hypothetical protein